MLLNFATEFLYDRFVVFGGSIDTAMSKKMCGILKFALDKSVKKV